MIYSRKIDETQRCADAAEYWTDADTRRKIGT
jgi:hypothetical protein